jgi:hypothetical protein
MQPYPALRITTASRGPTATPPPVGQPTAASATPKAQLDQRHIALARRHRRIQVGEVLMLARLAPCQQAEATDA